MDADADGTRTRDALLWAICWLVLAATIAVDAAISAVALSGSYGLAAVVAGALVTVPRTLLTGIGAVAAAAVSLPVE